jgi:hypothetical protein
MKSKDFFKAMKKSYRISEKPTNLTKRKLRVSKIKSEG